MKGRIAEPIKSLGKPERSEEQRGETERGIFREGAGWTEMFIYPGYEFRAVGAMVTNFHLPKSTLLMLVAALAGQERVVEAYGVAVREGYRFYSYGDAMLIL